MLTHLVVAGLMALGARSGLVADQPAEPAQRSADEQTPEQRIDGLKDKLKELEKSESKYLDGIAKTAVEVDKLSAEVDKMSANVALQWKRIDLMSDDLRGAKASLNYGGKEYKREEVAKQLASDFESVKVAEQALDAKKDLLSTRKQSLDAAKKQLSELGQRRDEMAARIAKMEADLKLARLNGDNAPKIDDKQYAKAKAALGELAAKIAEGRKALGPESGADDDPDKPKTPLSVDELLKQIDDYKAAHKPLPQKDDPEQR